MNRRTFLSASAGASLAFGSGFWRAAFATPAQAGPGPYGAPVATADANGIFLPEGFTSRIIGTSGQPVEGTTYPWHTFPDGAATFPAPDGGWFYACNSEVPGAGGVGAIRFGPDGAVVDAYPILTGTSANCAGGPTPWGTWLSCEEFDFSPIGPAGQVWECDPTRPGQGIPRPLMGRFSHEAAAVDPVSGRVFLTEDDGDSKIYAFHPDTPGNLSTGTLHALVVDPDDIEAHEAGYGPDPVSWTEVPEPLAVTASTRTQVPTAARFRRGEGMWFDQSPDGTRTVYWATTSDERIWALTLGDDSAPDTLETLYWGRDATRWPQVAAEAPLWDPDNLTVSPAGELFVSEDSGDLRISVLTNPDLDGGERTITPFLRLTRDLHDGSELTGPCFSPDGSRLYFSSQRGGAAGNGVTYEISGPFRTQAPPPVVPDFAPGVGIAVAGATAAGAWALSRRRERGGGCEADLDGGDVAGPERG